MGIERSPNSEIILRENLKKKIWAPKRKEIQNQWSIR